MTLQYTLKKTHNVALVSPVAGFIVSIGMNGKIQSQENQIAIAASRDPRLAAELKDDQAATVLGAEVIDDTSLKKPPRDGKLMVSEEIVEGHVTWNSFKLLLTSSGGDHPIAFFSVIIVALLLNEWTFTFQIWYVGYWGSQYESRPISEVPVFM